METLMIWDKSHSKYKIADITISIEAVGDLPHRCKEYFEEKEENILFEIKEEQFQYNRWPLLTKNEAAYMESGQLFYLNILNINGMMLHSSAIELGGKGYLFSGACGAGKSTHTRLWKKVFGESAKIFNDDKPALRRINNRWYAYGTPWCGKEGINQNIKVPLAGICFLEKGDSNSIRRIGKREAIALLLSQTTHRFNKIENLDKVLSLVDQLVREIPIYELTNRPEPEAAILSYETMRKGAEEAGL